MEKFAYLVMVTSGKNINRITKAWYHVLEAIVNRKAIDIVLSYSLL